MQIRVSSPCSQKWDDMRSGDGAAFCQACQKEVIDFTGMSDEQLRRFWDRQSQQVCGRFREGQLNRNLHQPMPRRGSGVWRFAWTFSAMCWGVVSPVAFVSAQQPAIQVPEREPASSKKQERDTTIELQIISGTVRTQAGEAVLGATLRVQGTQIGTLADKDGYFELKMPAGDLPQTLVATFIGYETQHIGIHAGTSLYEIVMPEAEPMLLGEIIVGGATERKGIFRRTWPGLTKIFRRN